VEARCVRGPAEGIAIILTGCRFAGYFSTDPRRGNDEAGKPEQYDLHDEESHADA
jgi:hypothetical protein